MTKTISPKDAGTRLCLPIFTPLLLPLLMLVLLLPACGPRDISSDAGRVDREYYGKGGPDPMADARFPIAGAASRKDYYFYRLNQPGVMENEQNRRMHQFNRARGTGGTSSVNGIQTFSGFNGAVPLKPASNDVPKPRSPFRQ